MLLPHVEGPQLFPEDKFADFPKAKVAAGNHWHEFVDAVRGMGTTSTPFSYSGPLTESVLLGGVSTHFPNQTLEWDAVGLAFKNLPDANRLIRRMYREGWKVAGLS
jgi:hypothetical protein